MAPLALPVAALVNAAGTMLPQRGLFTFSDEPELFEQR